MAAPSNALSDAQPPASYRPAGQLDLTHALEPYNGPWTIREAAHLLRRAGFGGSPDDLARLAARPVSAAVDTLIAFPAGSTLPAGPVLLPDTFRPYVRLPSVATLSPEAADPGRAAIFVQAPAVPFNQLGADDRKAVQMEIGQGRRHNIVAIQEWFLDRMIASPAPLQEKMTLLWHGHFTSAYQKGIPAQALVDQNNLFRRYALGNVRELTLAVSQDPAMLRYLDNGQNFKAHPNENYARELMELFTLGIGNYTESDVRESARSFTGWTIDPQSWTFAQNPRQHDTGSKTFLGRTGNFDGHDIVEIIFAQPAAARWFANTLLNFFVYNEPEPGLVDAVAALIHKNDFELQPVMATLLRSNVFYSERAYRALVKSPVEFIVGSYRLYGIGQVEPVALAALRRMGQLLFDPPNVKGWDGGAAWINSQAMLTRANFASGLVARIGDAAWVATAIAHADPDAVAKTLTQTILQGDVSAGALADLVAYVRGSDVAAMGMLSGENADERVRGAAYLTMAMPAFQLA